MVLQNLTLENWLAITVIALLLIFLALRIRRGGLATLVIEPPDLRFAELDPLLRNPGQVERRETPKFSADFAMQLFDGNASIIYHRSTWDGQLRETLDISVPRKAGLILDFTDRRLTRYKRIGGGIFQDPSLPAEVHVVLGRLLERVENYARIPTSA